jgi:hypothetical protein
MTGLPKDSVANVSQIIALDKSVLTARAGGLSGGEDGAGAGGNRRDSGALAASL